MITPKIILPHKKTKLVALVYMSSEQYGVSIFPVIFNHISDLFQSTIIRIGNSYPVKDSRTTHQVIAVVLKVKAYSHQFGIIFNELTSMAWGNKNTPRTLNSAVDHLTDSLKIIPDAVINVWKIGRRCKYKYWMIQGIKYKKDKFGNPLCNYDIYPLRSIVDIWHYFKIINRYYHKESIEVSMLDNFTLILAPKLEDNKLFRKNGTWYIWDYHRNCRFLGSYKEFLRYLDNRGGIKKSNILWARRTMKNTSKLVSEPLKP